MIIPPCVVPAGDEEGDAEGPHAARLRVLLHDGGHALNKLRGRNLLLVHQLVVLGDEEGHGLNVELFESL